MPFIVLSIVPVAFEFFAKTGNGWLGVVAVCNASLAANDLLIAAYLFFYVPTNANDVQVKTNGVYYFPKE